MTVLTLSPSLGRCTEWPDIELPSIFDFLDS